MTATIGQNNRRDDIPKKFRTPELAFMKKQPNELVKNSISTSANNISNTLERVVNLFDELKNYFEKSLKKKNPDIESLVTDAKEELKTIGRLAKSEVGNYRYYKSDLYKKIKNFKEEIAQTKEK